MRNRSKFSSPPKRSRAARSVTSSSGSSVTKSRGPAQGCSRSTNRRWSVEAKKRRLNFDSDSDERSTTKRKSKPDSDSDDIPVRKESSTARKTKITRKSKYSSQSNELPPQRERNPGKGRKSLSDSEDGTIVGSSGSESEERDEARSSKNRRRDVVDLESDTESSASNSESSSSEESSEDSDLSELEQGTPRRSERLVGPKLRKREETKNRFRNSKRASRSSAKIIPTDDIDDLEVIHIADTTRSATCENCSTSFFKNGSAPLDLCEYCQPWSHAFHLAEKICHFNDVEECFYCKQLELRKTAQPVLESIPYENKEDFNYEPQACKLTPNVSEWTFYWNLVANNGQNVKLGDYVDFQLKGKTELGMLRVEFLIKDGNSKLYMMGYHMVGKDLVVNYNKPKIRAYMQKMVGSKKVNFQTEYPKQMFVYDIHVYVPLEDVVGESCCLHFSDYDNLVPRAYPRNRVYAFAFEYDKEHPNSMQFYSTRPRGDYEPCKNSILWKSKGTKYMKKSVKNSSMLSNANQCSNAEVTKSLNTDELDRATEKPPRPVVASQAIQQNSAKSRAAQIEDSIDTVARGLNVTTIGKRIDCVAKAPLPEAVDPELPNSQQMNSRETIQQVPVKEKSLCIDFTNQEDMNEIHLLGENRDCIMIRLPIALADESANCSITRKVRTRENRIKIIKLDVTVEDVIEDPTFRGASLVDFSELQ
ncbi:hypothetical protein HDE_04088 [Halotydeus destructor]|nr:hypothetical protein HDE_04088 [Halotydeus destructor]